MQRTLAEQTAEVRQYTADRRVNQDQVHQQERAELDSNSIPRAPAIAYGSPLGLQSAQRSDSYAYNTGRQRPGYEYNVSNPRESPYSQQGVTSTSYAAPSPPTYSTAGGAQRSGFPAASAALLRQDPRTISGPPSPYTFNPSSLMPGYGTLYSPPPTEGGQESQRWTCLNCSNGNDPTRNPQNCNACSASSGSRPRHDGRDKRF